MQDLIKITMQEISRNPETLEWFINSDEESREEIAILYAQSAIKTFNKFKGDIQTNDKKMNAFKELVYSQLTEA